MSELFVAVLTAAVVGFVMHIATFSYVESGWKTDCEKIGFHVSASSGLKVYKCELVPEKSK